MEQARADRTDTQLVSSLKEGDDSAFEEILRRYERKVYSLVRGLTRNDEDAEDALQDAFLSIYRKIGSFKQEASLSTWIYRIAVNSALMLLRKRRRREERSMPLDDYLPAYDASGHRLATVPDWPPRADQALERKELAEFLRASIRELGPEYRTVFVLRDQEGLSNEEAAAVL